MIDKKKLKIKQTNGVINEIHDISYPAFKHTLSAMDKSVSFQSNTVKISKTDLDYTFYYESTGDQISASVIHKVTKQIYNALVTDPVSFTGFATKLKPRIIFGLLYEYSTPEGIKPERHTIITIPDKPKTHTDDVSVNIQVKHHLDQEISGETNIDFIKKQMTDADRHEITLKEQQEEIKSLQECCRRKDDAISKLTKLVDDMHTRLEKMENGTKVHVHTERIDNLEKIVNQSHDWCTRTELDTRITEVSRFWVTHNELDTKITKVSRNIQKCQEAITPRAVLDELNQKTFKPVAEQLNSLSAQAQTLLEQANNFYSKQEIDDKFKLLYESITKATVIASAST